MKHLPNENLVEGTYRIVCLGCNRVYDEGKGDLTRASTVAMGYSDICEDCRGEIVLETNPISGQNAYDATHPYPNH